MSLPEEDKIRNIEIGKILLVNPTDLMRDNPAALIVNKESYQRIAAHFSPEQFDPPQVVRVKTYASRQGEVIRVFVIDGLTRIKFASDHQEAAVPDYPNFSLKSIPIKEVTNSLLKNPLVVLPEERKENQQALTMIQYLRAVIPPTVEHSEIAPDRIAAHLINGWGNMVGKDLSRKFSALAALSFFDNPRVPTATDEMLHKFLESQVELVAWETKEERIKIQNALLEMGSIIRQSKLFKEQVVQAAFIHVTADSSVIGGEKEAQKQIYGLLHIPEVEKKITQAFSQIGEREEKRFQLGKIISQAFNKFAPLHDGQRTIDTLHKVLKDPNLDFSHVVDVFNSLNPSEQYDQVRQEINRDKLTRYYLRNQNKDKLTELESLLIDRFGKKIFLEEGELPMYTSTIKDIDVMLRKAGDFCNRLKEKHEELLKNGVEPQIIDGAYQNINSLYQEIFDSVQSRQLASRKTKELEKIISDAEKRIFQPVKIHKIYEIIEDVYSKEPKTEHWPEFKTHIFNFLHQEEGIDLSSEEQVRKKLMKLKTLNKETQSAVVKGYKKLEYELEKQRKDKTSTARKYQEEIVLVENEPPSSSEIKVRHLEQKGRTGVFENKELIKATVSYRELLYQLNLRPEEITGETKEEISLVLNKLGKLRFNHPEIVKIIKDYLAQHKSSS